MSIRSTQTILYFLVLPTFLHLCQTRSLGSDSSGVKTTDGKLWQPKEGTRSEWMACYGMPKDVCERTKIKYQRLQETLAKALGIESATPEVSSSDGCIKWTEEQIDMLMAEAKESNDATLSDRQKRKMRNLTNSPGSKWPMPIHFMFDGKHNEGEKTTIRNAFQHWMDNTCVRFRELATGAPFDDNHILLTRELTGCWSRIGRTASKPQPLNLQAACIQRFGKPVHEIGHALGLFHEQSRIDRDNFINIFQENINESDRDQFAKYDTDNYGVPYNYGSVMHYAPKSFSINGNDTMIALDPLYQMNMGQSTGLSFEDSKIINLVYCKDSCTSQLLHPCLRGGYQNPNNCSTCTCPDGFSGQYCDQVAPPKYATCGGVINLMPGNTETILSPGYDFIFTRYYLSHQECNWWIKAPENHQLQLTFVSAFVLHRQPDGACDHWVEIKYKRDLGLEGARFCGYRRPNVTITSQSNEMMIVFRSNYTAVDNFDRRGFQAIVKTIFTPVVGRNAGAASTDSTSTIAKTATARITKASKRIVKNTTLFKTTPVPVSLQSYG